MYESRDLSRWGRSWGRPSRVWWLIVTIALYFALSLFVLLAMMVDFF